MATARILSALAVLIVVAGAWWYLPDKVPQQPEASGAQLAGDSTLSMRWSVDRGQRYEVASSSSMRMKQALSSSTSVEVRMKCLLDILTLQSGPEDALVGIQLSEVKLTINGARDRATDRLLGTPFRVRFSSDGMPLDFDFPAAVDAHNRKILENLVRTFQVKLDPSSSWVTLEANGQGTYEARYQRSGTGRVEKAKLRFTGASAGMVTWKQVESSESFQLDPSHDWIATMEVRETMHSDGNGAPEMVVNNHATLALQSDVLVMLAADAWNFTTAPPRPTSNKQRPATEIELEKVRQQIHSNILQLDALERGRLALVHRLRDQLRVDERLPAFILEALKTQDLGDRTRADLYLALELTGTAGAQAALASVMLDTSWPLQDGMRAIVAMGGVDLPVDASITALWDATQLYASDGERQRMAGAATFALGSLGNTLYRNDDSSYSALRSELLGNALSAADTRQRANFITALGNTRDATLVDELSILLNDTDPAIRRATALSLGSLGIDPVAEQMVSHYSQEVDRYVRGAIAESLQSWSQPSEPALAMFRQTVLSEADERTRYNIAVLLSNNLDASPDNEAVLREIMRKEPSKRIRRKVAEALATSTLKP